MIAQIGEYKRTVFERSTELGIKVRKNEERLVVADKAQTFIEALQPLNHSVNRYQSVKTPEENLEAIIKKLEKFREIMRNERKALEGLWDGKKDQEPYPSLIHSAKTLGYAAYQYEQSLIAIKDQSPTEEQVRAIFGSYGSSDSLLKYFLQQQINTISQTAIDASYTLSGLYQDGSGLSQALLDAQFTGEGYSSQMTDYHNPITKAHSLDFSSKDKSKLVTVDLGEYGFKPKSMVDLAKRVALIKRNEEGGELYKESDDTVMLVNFRGEQGKIPGYTAAKKGLFVLVNSGIDVVSFGLDLLYSGFFAATGVVNLTLRAFDREPFKIPDFPSQQAFLQKWDIAEAKYKTLQETSGLFDKPPTQVINGGLFVTGMQFLGQQLTNFSLYPLGEVIKGVTVHFWEGVKDIYYDVSIGSNPISDQDLTQLLDARLEEEARITSLHKKKIRDLHHTYKEKISSDSEVLEQLSYSEIIKLFNHHIEATAAYRLNPDNPEDFVSWAANDFTRSIVEVFTKEIYRAHPIGGVAFTLAACTAAPMAMPFLTKLSFLHFIYTKMNLPIAKTLVGQTQGLMSSFSTAMINGKAAFLFFDLTSGKNSFAIRGAEMLIENPVLATIVGLATVGLGFEIAFQAHIPWLSSSIAEEAGHATFPYLELGVSGAKLAAIVIESGIRYDWEEDGESEQEAVDTGAENSESAQLSKAKAISQAQAKMEELRLEVRKAIVVGYKRAQEIGERSLTSEEEDQVEQQTTQYLNAFKDALGSDYTDATTNSLEKAITEYVLQNTQPSEETQAIAKELQENFNRARIRQQILQLEPDNLPQDEKYKIMHYVNTHYANNPEYVAAVKYKLMGGRERIGGLAGSIKMTLAYIPAVTRASLALILISGLAIASFFDPKLKEGRSFSFQPVQDLLDKARVDFGLIVRATANVVRIGWELVGAVLRVPIVIFYTLIASPLLIGQYLSSTHYFPTPNEMNSVLSELIFAPGKISQLFNAAIGFFRAGASAKHLEVATRDALSQEIGKNIAQLQPLITEEIDSQTEVEEQLELDSPRKMHDLFEQFGTEKVEDTKPVVTEKTTSELRVERALPVVEVTEDPLTEEGRKLQ
jgi:hypothetical protein